MLKKTVFFIFILLQIGCRIFIPETKYDLAHSYMTVSDFEPISFDYSPNNPYPAFFDSRTGSFDLGPDRLPIDSEMGPSILSRFGIAMAVDYLNTGSTDSYGLLKQAVYRLKNLSIETGGYLTWEFPTTNEAFNGSPGWRSGLTNAWAALAFLYYGQFSASIDPEESSRFLEYAKQAISHIFVPIRRGGAETVLQNGDIWYEEYPSEPRSHVLNGFIFILDVLHVFAYYYPTPYKFYLNQGIESAYHHIDKYNLPYTSLYDLYTNGYKIGSPYHTLHWRMVGWLYYITGNSHFRDIGEHWFNLDVQNIYTLTHINDSEELVQEKYKKINDTIFWYDGSSICLNTNSLTLTLPNESSIYGINFYLKDSNINNIPIIEVQKGSRWSEIDYAKLYQSRDNVSSIYSTVVSSIVFHNSVVSNKVRITFPKLPFFVREIGILYRQKNAFENKINQLADALNL